MFQVEVKDEAGRMKVLEQPFSLDGTRMSYQIMARILLMTNATAVVSSFIQYLVLHSQRFITVLRLHCVVSV